MFSDITFGGNQHSRWLYCRQCGASGALQTLDLMSCVRCSLTHIYHPGVDTRKTCVWTKWLKLISRYRFRMTESERSQLKEKIQKRQQQRRLRAAAEQPTLEEVQALQERARTHVQTESEQVENRGGAIHVEHASIASPYIVTTRHWDFNPLPRGTALQRDIRTGRTRLILTGEYIPYQEEDDTDHTVSAISMGAVKATTSDDHYCMLDSGANVMVTPWKEGVKGDHTMCALVGDNRTEGL